MVWDNLLESYGLGKLFLSNNFLLPTANLRMLKDKTEAKVFKTSSGEYNCAKVILHTKYISG